MFRLFQANVLLTLMASLLLTGIAPVVVAKDGKVVVYSARKEHLVKPLFEAFTKDSGIKVEYITDKAPPLLERLKSEGKRSPADIYFTVDAGNLWQASQAGVLQAVSSKVLDKNIPPHLKDPKNQWFAFSVRARTIAYSKERVKAADLKGYEDLADPKWKGKLCLRTSKKVYNQSLVAMLIAEKGEKAAEKIVKGWVNNLATKVFSNDTSLLKAIDAGQCDVGIVNSYYFGRLVDKDAKIKVDLFWPKKANGGTHVNISGAGLTKHAKQKKEAVALMEWLASEKAQKMFAALNFEFPVDPKVPASKLVQSWQPFDQILINVSKAGELQADAIKLMDRVGYK